MVGAAALSLVLVQAFPGHLTGQLSVFLTLACCLLVWAAIRFAKRASPPSVQTLILKDAREVLLGPAADLRMLQPTRLHAWRSYLSLQLLSLTDGRTVLVWPDSLSADARRKLRVWLKAQARGARELT